MTGRRTLLDDFKDRGGAAIRRNVDTGEYPTVLSGLNHIANLAPQTIGEGLRQRPEYDVMRRVPTQIPGQKQLRRQNRLSSTGRHVYDKPANFPAFCTHESIGDDVNVPRCQKVGLHESAERHEVVACVFGVARGQRLFLKLSLNLRIPRNGPCDVAADAMSPLEVRGRVSFAHGDACDMVTDARLNRSHVVFVNVGGLGDEIQQPHQLESMPQRHREPVV